MLTPVVCGAIIIIMLNDIKWYRCFRLRSESSDSQNCELSPPFKTLLHAFLQNTNAPACKSPGAKVVFPVPAFPCVVKMGLSVGYVDVYFMLHTRLKTRTRQNV